MIRFACPGCGASYTVDDSKAGKTGRCPKCQSQFQIPAAGEATAAPPTGSRPGPALPPADPNAPVEIAPCPGCQARLSVAAADLGIDVECPYCQTVYQATRPDGSATSSKIRVPVPQDDEERPSRRRRRDEEDEEAEDDRPSRRRRRDEDDEYDRPRKRKRSRRQNIESKKVAAGVLALLLGGWGIHKFYLGYTAAGIIQIVLTFITCGLGGIIPLVEGIIYLTKSDDEFIDIYQIGEKQWF